MSRRRSGLTVIAIVSAASTSAVLAGVAGAQDRSTEVCARWTSDRADRTEGTWTGDAASCNAGDNVTGRANALKLLNLYRFLVDMPEVVTDATLDANAQQCALMQTANNSLNHMPPTTWLCYTDVGATASSRSNISSGPGVQSMDLYMNDGSSPEVGHRRWILNNQLGPVGLGSAKASCFTNVGGTGNAGKAFVAWPPSGPVPLQAITTTKADTAGWTIQSDSINLNTATVTVMDGTTSLAVTLSAPLPANYGSKYAIKFVPSGWTSQAGHSYAVALGGTTAAVAYTIDVVDCGGDAGTGTTGTTGTTGGRGGRTTGSTGTTGTSVSTATGAATTSGTAATTGSGATSSVSTTGGGVTTTGVTGAGASSDSSSSTTGTGPATTTSGTATSGAAATSAGATGSATGAGSESTSTAGASSGSSGSTGSAGSKGADDPGSNGGCACSTASQSRSGASSQWLGWAVLGLAFSRFRRRTTDVVANAR